MKRLSWKYAQNYPITALCCFIALIVCVFTGSIAAAIIAVGMEWSITMNSAFDAWLERTEPAREETKP